ncbi:HAD-IIB family hydrolase [Vibrio sp.]|uniref:HAD-IIB family hydrolase n=1 Tax=Vibrio viridaestus TaxID=2487322 RepID=A0A3N9TEG8_9VIBR|nr:HAD-IIB family hydrolase [Vibrio viridaestus]MDC0611571.1 HAD-IIB family hydrolase [Vibrio sp.]RQW62509.1 HAD-IIB family hydrolase [Vibrio viridaestus]
MIKLLVYSDLDGTLLDHHTYSFDSALPAIALLESKRIPWILNTSKTFAELAGLRRQLNHHHPFITENGAAIYIPKSLTQLYQPSLIDVGDYWCKAFGPKRKELIATAKQFKDEFRFTGFNDLTVQDVVDLTGLHHDSAALAMQREYTEPLVWNGDDDELNLLRKKLQPLGLQVQKGGRFAHVMGESCDKSNAMNWLTQGYQSLWKEPVITVALGDGENDVGMLKLVDIPVVVRSPVHNPPQVPNRCDVRVTKQYGPAGWAEEIEKIVNQEEL